LPLYYKDNRKAKLLNCLETLNRQISRREGFTIAAGNKNSRHYEKIAKQFKNKKNLLKQASHNPSFRIFLDSLPK
jgi:hypothetical protein